MARKKSSPVPDLRQHQAEIEAEIRREYAPSGQDRPGTDRGVDPATAALLLQELPALLAIIGRVLERRHGSGQASTGA
jgi:hypothetical protein